MITLRLKQYLRLLSKHIRKRIKYGGNIRRCPICENGSRKFLEFGFDHRSDAQCPFCEAVERHRLFWLFLKRKSDFFTHPPKRVLHVAPEHVFEAKFRKILGDGYITADLLVPSVNVKMDITDIQYPENSFDFIYCSHVLEHVPNDRKAMREFRRVLADDGMAILLVPIIVEKTIEDPSTEDPKERLRLFGQEDHVREYGPDFADRLKEEGFNVEALCAEDFLSLDEIERMGITKSSGKIFVCRK